MLNMANSADPDEMPPFVASHLGQNVFVNTPFLFFVILCIDALTTSPQLRILTFRQATPLLVVFTV